MTSRGRFTALLAASAAMFLAAVPVLQAHVVSQIFGRVRESQARLEVEITMDAGWAWPAFRDDPASPQPSMHWLQTRTPDEFALIRRESELLLRKHLEFNAGGSAAAWTCTFPDFETFPPSFPELPGGFAWLTVNLAVPGRAGNALTVKERSGSGPDFVFGLGADRFITLQPGGSVELLPQRGAPPAGRPALVHFGLQGFLHVLPAGWDHMLFILGIFLGDRRFRPLLLQSLCFTAAHTVTLGLSISGFVQSSPHIVEPLIALSIAALAAENLWKKPRPGLRYSLIFLFGLIHGLGFGGALGSILAGHGPLPLIAANAGVEAAQAAVLLLAGGFFCLLGSESRQRCTARGLNILLLVTGIALAGLRLAGG